MALDAVAGALALKFLSGGAEDPTFDARRYIAGLFLMVGLG